MSQYTTLVKILDQLRQEAPQERKRYHPIETNQEQVDQARSRAFIHLYLKVKYGILDFERRERYITDETNDGGIDAYYIDKEQRNIFFVQSKFRTNEENFEEKKIGADDLLKMDVDRITKGHTDNEQGINYNSKIQELIKKISGIDDIGRYNFTIILLANVKEMSKDQLKRLLGDFPIEIFNFSRCYNELVFPIVSGTYFNNKDLSIDIDLSDKVPTSTRISYPVETEIAECDITVLFIPTEEIAKVLHKYKNSILKFNPRSYLSLSNNSVNAEIAKTIEDKKTNEFALFNNGITMLSDETGFNERTGRLHKGQLHVTNPQIINGGQTAYTLSQIYEKYERAEDIEEVFGSKEVMLKVITFSTEPNLNEQQKLKVIEEISKATNQQTAVIDADRRSNDKVQIELQKKIFTTFGYFYERKKGEFYDGSINKYINSSQIIDREDFLRVCNALAGRASSARGSSAKVLFRKSNFDSVINDSDNYRKMFFGYRCLMYLASLAKTYNSQQNNPFGVVNYGNAIRYGRYAVIYVVDALLDRDIIAENIEDLVKSQVDSVLSCWLEFEDYAKAKPGNRDYFRTVRDPNTGQETLETDFNRYYKASVVNRDLNSFFEIQ